MAILAAAVALLLIFGVLWDAFETIILPRRVRRRMRITLAVYRVTWSPLSKFARHMRANGRRETLLSFYGPLALIFLLFIWAAGLVVGFGLLQWACGSALTTSEGHSGFGTDLYMSGTTFFTLGLGDVVPHSPPARLVTVIESGTGFAFLALVIGYLPILYQAFSRREVSVSLLDARAGSPPSAVEMLRRLGEDGQLDDLDRFLRDWERWAAELLESHLSYPSLAFFRSQHENQSWLSSLTAILDVCALVLTGVEGIPKQQARLTFAMARHASVDLSQVLGMVHSRFKADRLSSDDLATLRGVLAGVGLPLRAGPEADAKLTKLRSMYEPYVREISDRLLLALPPWLPSDGLDDWQTSPDE
jgi:hypothetical protein